MSAPQPRIISASRRTDLPGHHAAACAARLARLRAPVHSVFFWTRFPGALIEPGPLAELVQGGIENPLVQLTLTGLGGSALEPRVPTTRQVLSQLDPLIAALRGEPERITWRFDPLIKGAMTPASFAALAAELAARGIRRCTISFPAARSLKGALSAQYQRYGIASWTASERRALALRLAEVAAARGIALSACAQPQVVQDSGGAITPACCISAELAVRLHPRQLPLALAKDPSQRRHCRCAVSTDIGRYSDRCRSGCAYCYSTAGGPEIPEPGQSERVDPQGSLF